MEKKFFKQISGIVVGLGLLIAGGVSLAHVDVSETRAAAGTDTLNATTLGLKSTYANFTSNAFDTTGTVYVGNGMVKDSTKSTIQLRSTNKNSGIVVKTSPGKATNISITWNTGTASNRVLNIYGKADAYASAADLYDSAKRGSLLTSFKYASGTTTASFDIDGTQKYIGIRSNSGALYLDSVQITWAEISTTEPTVKIDQTNLELVAGNTGTLTATTTNAGENSIVWSSSDTSVVTIDSASGLYEALKIGSSDIIATLTVDGVNYTSKITILVNGDVTVDEAYSLASALDTGVTTAYKVTVKEKITSVSSNEPYSVYFTTTDSKTLQVYFAYTQPTNFDEWIVNGVLNVTGNLQHFYNSKTSTTAYEIVNPTVNSYIDDAIKFADSFLTLTSEPCKDVNGNNLEALKAPWSNLASAFQQLDSYAQAKIQNAKANASGSDVENAVARYDHIVSKYGSDLTDFIGRVDASSTIARNRIDENNSFVIILVSILSVVALGGTISLVFIKKRKSH